MKHNSLNLNHQPKAVMLIQIFYQIVRKKFTQMKHTQRKSVDSWSYTMNAELKFLYKMPLTCPNF